MQVCWRLVMTGICIFLGDGGGGNDTAEGHVAGGNGQDISQNLLGSILRIDVNATEEIIRYRQTILL